MEYSNSSWLIRNLEFTFQFDQFSTENSTSFMFLSRTTLADSKCKMKDITQHFGYNHIFNNKKYGFPI